MNTVYLALGSNLQSPQRQLRRAIESLRKIPRIQLKQVAAFYKNEAYGRKTLPDYYNTVVQISTSLSPRQLLNTCQKIELQQGRIRRVRWAARTLDIDIIFYGNRILSHPSLQIPHPRYQERTFVLVPLQELGWRGSLRNP